MNKYIKPETETVDLVPGLPLAEASALPVSDDERDVIDAEARQFIISADDGFSE